MRVPSHSLDWKRKISRGIPEIFVSEEGLAIDYTTEVYFIIFMNYHSVVVCLG